MRWGGGYYLADWMTSGLRLPSPARAAVASRGLPSRVMPAAACRRGTACMASWGRGRRGEGRHRVGGGRIQTPVGKKGYCSLHATHGVPPVGEGEGDAAGCRAPDPVDAISGRRGGEGEDTIPQRHRRGRLRSCRRVTGEHGRLRRRRDGAVAGRHRWGRR